jgi:hypothetical protein
LRRIDGLTTVASINVPERRYVRTKNGHRYVGGTVSIACRRLYANRSRPWFHKPENPGYRLCDAPRFVGCQMVAPERPFFQVIDRLDILV